MFERQKYHEDLLSCFAYPFLSIVLQLLEIQAAFEQPAHGLPYSDAFQISTRLTRSADNSSCAAPITTFIGAEASPLSNRKVIARPCYKSYIYSAT